MGDAPLQGLTCIELSERGGAAYAGKLLRRLGAEVVKVESSEGDLLRKQGSRQYRADGRTTTPAFDFFNDGKTTRICRGAAELRDLIADADAFIVDIDLSRYDAWGLHPETLDTLGTRIVCAITPFGFTGPYAGYKGPELVTSAFGGMNVGIGEPGRPPLNMPFMQTAVQTGLTAAIAVIGDLVDVGEQDGTTVVDISETDVWATIHAGTTMVSFLFSNRLRKREGRRVLGQPYPHGIFRCKDGWIAVQASERHQYNQFIEMVGSPPWGTDRRFGNRMRMNNKHADEIDALLNDWFGSRTRLEIFAECRRRKIPAAPVRNVSEVRADPDLISRGVFETYPGATGVAVTVPVPPFRFRNAGLTPPGPVPPPPPEHGG